MTARSICLTFDIDLVDHSRGIPVDEFATALPAIEPIFDRHPHWVATWFIRLDDQIAALMGAADALLEQHDDLLRRLRGRGHEVGWHPHAYTRTDEGGWRQNTDSASVADELARLAPAAKAWQLSAVRTGWGFHTNATMRAIADAGFAVDSSAIPRPRYAWEQSVKDWTGSPLHPYRPSARDYRVAADPRLPLVEIPISVAAIAAPYDTEAVLRYVNPAFHAEAIAPAMPAWFQSHDHLVSVTHPYEVMPAPAHGLIAHDAAVFERNVEAIERLAAGRGEDAEFLTITQFAERACR